MPEKTFSLVEELVDHYQANRLDDGSLEILMKVPKEFSDLVLLKLTELKVSSSEVELSRVQ